MDSILCNLICSLNLAMNSSAFLSTSFSSTAAVDGEFVAFVEYASSSSSSSSLLSVSSEETVTLPRIGSAFSYSNLGMDWYALYPYGSSSDPRELSGASPPHSSSLGSSWTCVWVWVWIRCLGLIVLTDLPTDGEEGPSKELLGFADDDELLLLNRGELWE